MKIRFHGYNTFVLEGSERKIAIDPGISFYIPDKGRALIPEEDRQGLTHLFITHGDPDHADDAAKLAIETGAKIIGGTGLLEGMKELGEEIQKHNLDYTELGVSQVSDIDGIAVEGLDAKHGPLPMSLIPGLLKIGAKVVDADEGGFRLYLGPIKIFGIKKPMKVRNTAWSSILFGLLCYQVDNINFASGSIGYSIVFEGKTIVNTGDTLLVDSWREMNPDVLMLPIGGTKLANTMNEKEALEAVRVIQPKLVIPCHYNCPALFSRNGNPADDQMFKNEVQKMGMDCRIIGVGDEIAI